MTPKHTQFFIPQKYSTQKYSTPTKLLKFKILNQNNGPTLRIYENIRLPPPPPPPPPPPAIARMPRNVRLPLKFAQLTGTVRCLSLSHECYIYMLYYSQYRFTVSHKMSEIDRIERLRHKFMRG